MRVMKSCGSIWSGGGHQIIQVIHILKIQIITVNHFKTHSQFLSRSVSPECPSWPRLILQTAASKSFLRESSSDPQNRSDPHSSPNVITVLTTAAVWLVAASLDWKLHKSRDWNVYLFTAGLKYLVECLANGRIWNRCRINEIFP